MSMVNDIILWDGNGIGSCPIAIPRLDRLLTVVFARKSLPFDAIRWNQYLESRSGYLLQTSMNPCRALLITAAMGFALMVGNKPFIATDTFCFLSLNPSQVSLQTPGAIDDPTSRWAIVSPIFMLLVVFHMGKPNRFMHELWSK